MNIKMVRKVTHLSTNLARCREVTSFDDVNVSTKPNRHIVKFFAFSAINFFFFENRKLTFSVSVIQYLFLIQQLSYVYSPLLKILKTRRMIAIGENTVINSISSTQCVMSETDIIAIFSVYGVHWSLYFTRPIYRRPTIHLATGSARTVALPRPLLRRCR